MSKMKINVGPIPNTQIPSCEFVFTAYVKGTSGELRRVMASVLEYPDIKTQLYEGRTFFSIISHQVLRL